MRAPSLREASIPLVSPVVLVARSSAMPGLDALDARS
jgi:hypothetical protein